MPRVFAVLRANETQVELFGFGEYIGDEVPPVEGVYVEGSMAPMLAEAGVPNPKIVLDSGAVVWGCECWHGPAERWDEFVKGREVVQVQVVAMPYNDRSQWTAGITPPNVIQPPDNDRAPTTEDRTATSPPQPSSSPATEDVETVIAAWARAWTRARAHRGYLPDVDASGQALVVALRAEHERARKAEEALGWMANNVFGLRLRDKDGEECEYLADCDDSPVPREGGESFEAWIRDVAAHYQQTLAARGRESGGGA